MVAIEPKGVDPKAPLDEERHQQMMGGGDGGIFAESNRRLAALKRFVRPRVFQYIDCSILDCPHITHEIVASGILKADSIYNADTGTVVSKLPQVGCRNFNSFSFEIATLPRRVGGVEIGEIDGQP